MEETAKKHFSSEQIAQLNQRHEQLGEQYIRQMQTEWPELIVGATF